MATESLASQASPASAGEMLLSLRDIRKSFGGVQALRGACIDVVRGKVTALVGDNGAGKSTLIKIVMGVHAPTSGKIVLEGQEINVANPESARSLGIEAIYQDLALVGTFDLVQNFFLGRERTRSYLGGLIKVLDKAAMREEALEVLTGRVGISIGNPYANAFVMSGGQRQAVAIGRALHSDARLIIMDEPTAALGVEETDRVLAIIERLRDQGLTVLMVSHNLEHVFRCADSIAVMHRGEVNAQVPTSEVSRQDIVTHIMGSRAVG
ncbi:MAG: ATP-binding cassette domain-containing protein [Paracoccaceae bacterium]|nr:ATP-binding cassette domain-containing protein [Paracoccaceae bacterium]